MGAVKQSKRELQSEGTEEAGNNLLKHVILSQVSTHTLTQEGKYKEKQRIIKSNRKICAQRTNGKSIITQSGAAPMRHLKIVFNMKTSCQQHKHRYNKSIFKTRSP